MGWGNRWDWDTSGPIRRSDGIKAQTQHGKFGKSWWAGLWLAALERLIDSGRLARGRSYARSGQVVNLDVEKASVVADVQGSRPKPYKVHIQFKALSDEEWDNVIEAIASQAIYAAKLLSGEMPSDMADVFKAAGASLFPAKGADLETSCSCPDWANPCKHVAAVYLILGERFDADPFLIFEMRGRTKEAITAALRARRAGALGLEVEAAPQAAIEDEEVVVPLFRSLDGFWTMPAGVQDMEMTLATPQVDALPVKGLGKPAFWHSERDLVRMMEKAYRAISDRARKMALGEV
ncbi:MAG: SWIM zinc finger family protein [Chloroflexi bacterium]|nr:SWIM zinc finger family protein [Chloroflexota bacterium]